MQPDNLQSLHGLIEVAADSVLDHRAQLLHSVSLCMDAVSLKSCNKILIFKEINPSAQ
jgi:hypothetical protein